MSSSKKDNKELANGWVLCTSKSSPGRKYYFNRKTGKSSWADDPQDDDKVSSANKRKPKKPKCNQSERKREDVQQRPTKRKSGETDSKSPAKRKCKDVTATHEKSYGSSTQSEIGKSQPKTDNNVRAQHESKANTPSRHPKNLASIRLAQLQSRLSSEAQNDESSSSENIRNKNNLTIPETGATKIPKTNSITPDTSESKSSISHSPGNDTLTVLSPSQFLTANKIISSMKAHLTEEYSNQSCHKNTFADIEEGISKQTTEYPFMKHPSTPPQFSEANKLVSAIKSKLTYKASGSKEAEFATFRKAEDRMAALRARLSKEAEESENSFSSMNNSVDENSCDVSMEMDYKPEPLQCKAPVEVQTKHDAVEESNDDVVLVVDTNIFIHELDIAKDIANSHLHGYSKPPTLLVPWRVINELDRLKDNNNGNGSLSKRAKAAMDYLYKSLPNNKRIKGQSLRDANSHIYPCESPDDEILNCCLQQAERGKTVIMVSNDKNLCSKTNVNGMKSVSLADLRPLLRSRPRDNHWPAAPSLLRHWVDAMHKLLSNILENEMRAKYEKLWQHVLFKPPPWTLADVLQCLLKHWIAVFSEVFPRIEHIITDLSNALKSIQNKDPKSVSQSEAANFHELCLDVARKCQIIPEYMDLAKRTVEGLQRGGDLDLDRDRDRDPDLDRDPDGGDRVVEALESLWTVFSSYCAKLSTQLGVAHDLEDKLANSDRFGVLHTKCDFFIEHLSDLTDAMRGVLESESNVSAVRSLHEAVCRGINLELIETRQAPSAAQLAAFCTNCRNMLQEAGTKFFQLLELLQVCKQNFAID